MKWQPLSTLAHKIKLPPGYGLAELHRSDISEITLLLRNWYPDIVVGAESCHLEPEFYYNHAFFPEDGEDKPILAMSIMDPAKNKVGLITLEKNDAALTLTSRMGVIAPTQRGKGLAHLGPSTVEVIGRAIGAELLYYFVTLKAPHQQTAAEKAGFQIVGIVPAFDRDMVAPGQVRRVYEAIYAKPLVDDKSVFYPPTGALTQQTQVLWNFLFKNRMEEL